MNNITQLLKARAGTVSPEMEAVAIKERRDVEFIRERVASGRIVIPANINHKGLSPVGIGRELTTKINANIGNSALSSCPKKELEKLDISVKYGADTIMDLSTGGDISSIRKSIIEHSTIPVGTVPIYEATARAGGGTKLSAEIILKVIEEQAEQGVDYMTIHAGLLRAHVPLALKRKLKIVSRGGALMAQWMELFDSENPIYTNFDRILEVCRKYDVTLSLGDGLRPGCLADASDAAQFAELETLGELVNRSRKAGVQAMVEGPGHIPFDQIEMNMRREREICDDAPFYILGPIVTDCAPGYDHLVGAIGGTMGAYHGAAMLCYVTPKEHIGLPEKEDVRNGLIAFRIAAHAADIALKKPGARERDDAISDAREAFDWERQFELAMDPDRAREYRTSALKESGGAATAHGDSRFCTMCGPDFCSMRISSQIKLRNPNP